MKQKQREIHGKEDDIKVKLFDRIFKPQVITLANGKTVERPRSRMPLIAIALFLAIWWALRMTGFDLSVITTRFSKMLDLLKKIFQPDWSFFPKVINPLLDTIKMSILGTVIGCLLALPIAILSSSNINKNVAVVSVFRFILGLIRTLPTLILAQVCALIFSLWSACVPQILPVYLSHSLYCFEMNIRASAILGYVGAGGLGITINERVGWRDYNGLGMVLLTLFVVVVAIEFFSEHLRKKLS